MRTWCTVATAGNDGEVYRDRLQPVGSVSHGPYVCTQFLYAVRTYLVEAIDCKHCELGLGSMIPLFWWLVVMAYVSYVSH